MQNSTDDTPISTLMQEVRHHKVGSADVLPEEDSDNGGPQTEPEENPSKSAFDQLGLRAELTSALQAAGYTDPTPIQAAAIPPLAEGRDVLGQARTGTGKTAAFALPLLHRINVDQREPQVLVLTPTRELAQQVAESFRRYAAEMNHVRVTAVYGGSGYGEQLRALRHGSHVVVGTPGRVIDHLKRGSLNTAAIQAFVLDEADEMLRMGFVDDVEWILSQAPETSQRALFSATMPGPIRSIADNHLRKPVVVRIESDQPAAGTVTQQALVTLPRFKYEALRRILEFEQPEAVIVFARLKSDTTDIAERLTADGVAAAALNGDMPQPAREEIVSRLREGRINVVVATDVAARGLDVPRISHVINYDPPQNSEAYIHRIGRTGRAGRQGTAILLLTPKERFLLKRLQRATGVSIEQIEQPSVEVLNERRLESFVSRVAERLNTGVSPEATELAAKLTEGSESSPEKIAAVLISMLNGDQSFYLEPLPERRERRERDSRDRNRRDHERADSGRRQRSFDADRSEHSRDRRNRETADSDARNRRDNRQGRDNRRLDTTIAEGMERFRLEIGFDHGVRPGNIIGAIANEAGLDNRDIGKLSIFGDHSIIDLPEGMPRSIFHSLKKTRVVGEELRISRAGRNAGHKSRPPAGPRDKRRRRF